MKVIVTGATGFIGRHVVAELQSRGDEIHAISRDRAKAEKMPWFKHVTYISADIHDPHTGLYESCGIPDVLIHLAWSGLPNYDRLSHFEETLPADYRFIKQMVGAGVQHVLVTGTCFEYGLKNGCLSEDMDTNPVTPYGLAKDTLRKFLESLQKIHPFTLQWIRLFYMYGPGQNPKSLLSLLDAAIDRGETVFKMSQGEQLRDYLPVEEVSKIIVDLASHQRYNGIINCCSSTPISIRRLVEEHVAKRKAKINLELGYYPYQSYEPMAFWGSNTKLRKILESK